MIDYDSVLAVDFRRIDVQAADQSDQVRNHDALAEFVDDAHRRVGTGADPNPIRVFAAVADDEPRARQ